MYALVRSRLTEDGLLVSDVEAQGAPWARWKGFESFAETSQQTLDATVV